MSSDGHRPHWAAHVSMRCVLASIAAVIAFAWLVDATLGESNEARLSDFGGFEDEMHDEYEGAASVGMSKLYDAPRSKKSQPMMMSARSAAREMPQQMPRMERAAAASAAAPEMESGDRDELGGASGAASGASSAEVGIPASRMMVKHGSLALQVPRSRRAVEAVAASATEAVEKSGGYVESSSQSQDNSGSYSYSRHSSADEGSDLDEETRRAQRGEQLRLTMCIRVPVDKFPGLMESFRKMDKVSVLHESTETEDVTSRYVDAAARATALQATHDQLLEIMKRAGEVKDVLNVQRELGRVRQDLEAQKQQQRWLQKEASLSSISLTIQESPPSGPRPTPRLTGPMLAVKRSVEFWGELFEALVNGSIYLALMGLPLVAALGAIMAGVWQCSKRLLKVLPDVRMATGSPQHSVHD